MKIALSITTIKKTLVLLLLLYFVSCLPQFKTLVFALERQICMCATFHFHYFLALFIVAMEISLLSRG